MKVVRLSALRTGRLYPPGNTPGKHSCQRLSRPQGHGAAGRIMSMKNSSDPIGNQTHNLPVLQCSAHEKIFAFHELLCSMKLVGQFDREIDTKTKPNLRRPHSLLHRHQREAMTSLEVNKMQPRTINCSYVGKTDLSLYSLKLT